MIPDMKAVMLLYAITNVACAAFMAVMWYFNRRRFAGISFWLTDMVLQAIGTILIVLRGVVPDFFSMTIANILIIVGILFIYIGLENFSKNKSSQIHNYILIGIFIAVLIYFTHIRSSLPARNFDVSAITFILTFQCAYLMFRRVAPNKGRAASIVGIVFSGYAFTSIIRIIFLVLFPLHSSDFFKSGAPDTFIIISYTILTIGLVISLILLVNSRLIEDILIQTKLKDITAMELKENEEKYRTLIEKANESILIIQDDNFVFANPRANELLGMPDSDFIGKSFIDFVWPDDRKLITANHRKRLAGEMLSDNYDFRIIGRNGEPVWVLMSAALIQYKSRVATLIMLTDISERKNKENEIIYLSYHDKLTEIYNRRFVEEEIKRLNTKRQLPLSIIMGDLNSLKLTNDAFGHNTGDALLRETARLLKKICRSDDILARWGGDEFLILLPKTSTIDSGEIVIRIKNECLKLVINNIPLGLAIGIATKTEESQDINKIILEAEINMYKNKLTEKERSASSTIFALEQALFEKSNETSEHALRIKDNALHLGKSVKLQSQQLEELSLLSSLHDIGKVAMPETLLLKAESPTEEEWTVIKRHLEIGSNIAASFPQIVHIAKFILACHENWDGSGYPKGLKGEEIPIISRIMFICDAYDVMTSERIYKKAMSKEDAIKELRRCAGTQFDPVLVDKFIKMI